MVLLQRTPVKLEPFLQGAYQKVRRVRDNTIALPVCLMLLFCGAQISAINGVVQYRDPHFWTLSGNDWFGTITLVIRPDANDQETRKAAQHILQEIGVNRTTIQVERF